jgi:hypothetical protein
MMKMIPIMRKGLRQKRWIKKIQSRSYHKNQKFFSVSSKTASKLVTGSRRYTYYSSRPNALGVSKGAKVKKRYIKTRVSFFHEC